LLLNALQGFKQNILKHHKRFTDKTFNHIIYVDKQLWGSPDDALKHKILSDAEKKNNKVIVVYDFATGEKEVVHQPENNQNLDFNTIEVISPDSKNQDIGLKGNCRVFAMQQGWKESKDLAFRVNTAEGYEALNLKSNDKNKHNIILSIGEDKVTRDAAKALFDKHPRTFFLRINFISCAPLIFCTTKPYCLVLESDSSTNVICL
jgi:hypothetical protein